VKKGYAAGIPFLSNLKLIIRGRGFCCQRDLSKTASIGSLKSKELSPAELILPSQGTN